MKKQSGKEFLQIQVGAFVVVGILLAMTAIFMLGSRSGLFKDYYTLYSYFEDISGLRVGSQIQLAGVKVGYVEAISFEEVEIPSAIHEEPVESLKKEPISKDRQLTKKTQILVKVAMKLDTNYQKRINDDSVATIQTQGILGDQMIFLTIGSSKKGHLKNGDFIQNVTNISGFQSIVQQGNKLMKKAENVLPGIEKMTTHINSLLKEIRTGKGLAHEIIYGKESGNTIKSLSKMALNLEKTSQNLVKITNKINNGEGTIGAFINDPTLFDDMKTLIGKANRNKLVKSVIRHTLKTREKEQ